MALFLLASASFAATSITLSLLFSLETSLLSKSPFVMQLDDVNGHDMTIAALHDEKSFRTTQMMGHQLNQHEDGIATTQYEYYEHQHHNRRLQLSMTEEKVTTTSNTNNNENNNNAIIGQSTNNQGVIVNMLRRARDKVDEKDVPFLLQVPYTNSDVIYNIMTECYGLVGREYWDVKDLQRDEKENVVDSFYVSSHDRPKEVSCCVNACIYY